MNDDLTFNMRLNKVQKDFLFNKAKDAGMSVKKFILKKCGYWEVK